MSFNSANQRQKTKHVIESSLEDDLTDEESVDHSSKENDTSSIFVQRKNKVYDVLETSSEDESLDGSEEFVDSSSKAVDSMLAKNENKEQTSYFEDEENENSDKGDIINDSFEDVKVANASDISSFASQKSVDESSFEDIKNNTEKILDSSLKEVDTSMFVQRQERVFNIIETDSEESVNSDGKDVIECSSDEEKAADGTGKNTSRFLNQWEMTQNIFTSSPKVQEKKFHQPTLEKFVAETSKEPKKLSPKDYEDKIAKIMAEMMRIKKTMTSVNLNNLADKGTALKTKFESLKNELLQTKEDLKNLDPSDSNTGKTGLEAVKDNWQKVQVGLATVQPKTFGNKGLQNHHVEKALTEEALMDLYGSLENCPKDNDLAEDPRGLKVELLHHQKRALAWLSYRETKKPAGGILADDMGLGKTLSLLSLIVKKQESDEKYQEQSENSLLKYTGKNLIICPASLIIQWGDEIESKIKAGVLSYNTHHGPKRETKAKKLTQYDVVITTYATAMSEHKKNGPLYQTKWTRIILDEAHTIRNHKSQTSVAVCSLSAKYRWALTGTPVHNKELDMYALIKFLRCTPFDDINVYKRWVGDKSTGGGERLHTVISSLMLRRTKAELMENGTLKGMPSKTWELIEIKMDEMEFSLYQRILIFSQTLFTQYLHQHAEKNQDVYLLKMQSRNEQANPNQEYIKMRERLLKLNKMGQINSHEILVLLLRLRQICCHPSLITGMLQGDEDLGDEETSLAEELNLLDQLNRLNLEEDDESSENDGNKNVPLKEAAKGLFNPSHPIYERERISSKTKTILKLLENVMSAGEKVLIISQWKSHLDLIGLQLKKMNVKFKQFDGTVPPADRMEIVRKINDPNSRYKVLLLSLTAGGVGLNLTGANHIFLIDLHWNPQLESQAQDRIFRVGQTKPVFVHKFMTLNSIEESIKNLQEKKLKIAENLLTGSKQVIANKLSLMDLKMLFNM